MSLEMKLGLGLHLKQQLQLVMTPQLQQAIRLLQLSRMELIDAIHAELEQNPVLEEELRADKAQTDAEAAINGEEPRAKDPAPEPDRAKEVAADSSTAHEIDWEQWLESYNSTPSQPGGIRRDHDDLPNLEQTLTHSETLPEHLMWQLSVSNFVDDDRTIAGEIIGALDDSGFLPGEHPLEEIAIRLGVSVDHVERVLGLVQTFDPVGIAARTLPECLMIQMRYYGHDNKLAERMILEFMPELEKRNFQAIAKRAECTMDEVGNALRVVQSLDPRPARNFGEEKSIYITPDLYVHKVGDEYVIVANEDGLPLLRVSRYYQSALANGMNGEAKRYVVDKLKSAQWLIRSIHQRQRTIYKVMDSILKFQRDFFDRGIEHLKPLILRDVAEDIGMHESTISRVTSNKYVHTPRGIFELKYFFNSSIGRPEGDDMASISVKHRIKQLIDTEDVKCPHSDQAIVEILAKEGIEIARRTVAKYRESMGVLSSSKRKKII